MAWVRTGDTAANDPRVLALEEHRLTPPRRPGDREALVRGAVWGWISLCASNNAAHRGDRVLHLREVRQVAGGYAEEAMAIAARAGLVTKVARQQAWQIVDDPELLHVRTREEITWERARTKDTANPALMAELKARDGDACRYCGAVVLWRDRSQSGRSATIDHRNGPSSQGRVDEIVIACRSCNSSRKRDDLGDWDAAHPLLPIPTVPWYSEETAEYLTRHGRPTQPSKQPPARLTRPDRQSDPATTAAPATPQPAGPRTFEPVSQQLQRADESRTRASSAESEPLTCGDAPPPLQRSAEDQGADRVGTGRVGSGRAGTGREPTAHDGPAPPPRSRARRGRRGSRGGSARQTGTSTERTR